MERASVKRLYRDRSSHETIMLMETVTSGQKIRVTVPFANAGVLALEAHGVNDRCALYGVFAECVRELGGAFRSVVVAGDESQDVRCAISLYVNGRTTWISADVVELVAFALHVRIPIYVDRTGAFGSRCADSDRREPELPTVFVDAISDILSSDAHGDPPSGGGEDRTDETR